MIKFFHGSLSTILHKFLSFSFRSNVSAQPKYEKLTETLKKDVLCHVQLTQHIYLEVFILEKITLPKHIHSVIIPIDMTYPSLQLSGQMIIM